MPRDDCVDDAKAQLATEHFEKSAAVQAMAAGTVTPCLFTYKLPGEPAVLHELLTDHAGLVAAVLEELATALEQYGYPWDRWDSLFEEACPIKFAMARDMPNGEFVVHGNWATGMQSLTRRYTAMIIEAATVRAE